MFLHHFVLTALTLCFLFFTLSHTKHTHGLSLSPRSALSLSFRSFYEIKNCINLIYRDLIIEKIRRFMYVCKCNSKPFFFLVKRLQTSGSSLFPGADTGMNFRWGRFSFFIKWRALKMVLKLQISYKNRGDSAPLERPYIRPCVFHIILLSL